MSERFKSRPGDKKIARPTLPDPSRVQDFSTRQVLSAAKQILDVFTGNAGDKLDSAVTWRDLVGQNIVKAGERSGPGQLPAMTPAGGNTSTVVGALTNLTTNGAFSNIILTWDGWRQSTYAHAEVWRSATDDLGTAVLLGTAPAGLYTDAVGAGSSFYYWIRPVSTSGYKGAYNATAGVLGETTPGGEYVLEQIGGRAWTATQAYSLFEVVIPTAGPVTLGTRSMSFQCIKGGESGASEPDWSAAVAFGDVVLDGTVEWKAIDASRAPLILGLVDGEPMVRMPGAYIQDASIESAKIKNLAADKIYAASGTIAAALIGEADITNAMIGNAVISTAKIADAAITSAKIGEAAITNAKIGEAAVDTLKLAGQAVTFPVSAYTSGSSSVSTSWNTVVSLSVTRADGKAQILASFAYSASTLDTSGATLQARILLDGVVIWSGTVASAQGQYAGSSTNYSYDPPRTTDYYVGGYASGVATPVVLESAAPGLANLTLQVRKSSSSLSASVSNRYLGYTELKR